ncbi:tyrosine-type recombinase/integrase [Arthrobacter sp. NPDC080082]|uniref:tyrosine-type recombinase/integrase n=1 Tax=unclassified Arthrobacter TaxID=235627 RepID=UPI0034182389
MTTPPSNKIQTARRSWNDHTPPPQEQQPPALQPIPDGPLTSASIEDIINSLKDCRPYWPHLGDHGARIRRLLTHLRQLPGETWQDRWALFEGQVGDDALTWRLRIAGGSSKNTKNRNEVEGLNAAIGPLLALDVMRPSHRWLAGQRFAFWKALSRFRDAAHTAELENALVHAKASPAQATAGILTLGRVQAHTGKSIRQLTAEDILDLTAQLPGKLIDVSRSGLTAVWPVLHERGWIRHDSGTLPTRLRVGPKTVDEMVDYYGITGPCREPFIRYLQVRSAGLDYSSLCALGRYLAGLFFADIVRHYPGHRSFALTPDQAAGWKARVKVKADGSPRREVYSVFFSVRAFYLDISQWALEDAYWAQWAAPSPVTFAETRGYVKHRRATIATMQQRTRELAPVLPRLVEAAEQALRAAEATLANAKTAGAGQTIDMDGEAWEVFQSSQHAHVRIRRNGKDRDLSFEEDNAFWTWALVETLRHTGARIEEVLELVHMSIQPYKVPGTGETIPLLHFAPSKTDTERLMVAGPELVHVLYRVLSRVTKDAGGAPLTQRWDSAEKVLSSPLPHLFVRRRGAGPPNVMTTATVSTLLNDLAARAHIKVSGAEVRFTPHDFRRIFATEALASGLPPHIVQVLMGHASLATTQGYAAIYPRDVIRHHRTFIEKRRVIRPTEEYREPTAAEWDEFEAHFVQRKLSLGSCGRAYGTGCQHEHACLRCALLRPDPAQTERLQDIIDNLRDRITEAKQHGWIGDVEGLRVTLSSAEIKLAQMFKMQSQKDRTTVDLGTPRIRAIREPGQAKEDK